MPRIGDDEEGQITELMHLYPLI